MREGDGGRYAPPPQPYNTVSAARFCHAKPCGAKCFVWVKRTILAQARRWGGGENSHAMRITRMMPSMAAIFASASSEISALVSAAVQA